jgi:hypothetical protein
MDTHAKLPPPATPPVTYVWWLVLALVGLDYFSTLAYLPGIAVEAAGGVGGGRELVPFIGLGVVLVTFVCALPVYWYVAGRAPDGEGATGMLDRLIKGWFGKLLLLGLLGFVAADFLITRTLSTADAAVHIRLNPYWIAHGKEVVRSFSDSLGDWCNDQLLVTVVLAIIAFGAYAYIFLGFTRAFLRLAFTIVGLYLLLTGVVVVAGLVYLGNSPDIFNRWLSDVKLDHEVGTWPLIGSILMLLVLTFPHMALGLSGFELSLTSIPLIEGKPDDNPEHPRGRIRNARKLLVVAALIMGVFILASLTVVSLLIPVAEIKGDAKYRALAYLAHGGAVEGSPEGLLPMLFNPIFGTLYDVVNVLILGFAGASATLGSRQLVPRLLARYGMQLEWAGRMNIISHLLNVVMLVVLVVFRADVGAQVLAYAASVLALLTGASVAAMIDVWRRNRHSWLRLPVTLPFALICVFFLAMAVFTLRTNWDGLTIALIVVLTVLLTAFLSRYLRSKELRFQGFEFEDAATEARWDVIRQLHFQVLVPHRPGRETLAEKEEDIRKQHRLGPEVPIIFIEAELGDPSEFYQRPRMSIHKEDGREIIRVTGCASIPHVLAAICLEFRHIGAPPEIHFDWSNEPALTANLHFLLFGQGNIPWMVHELIRHAEPDLKKQPRVVVG